MEPVEAVVFCVRRVGGGRRRRGERETSAQPRGGGESPVLAPGHSVVVNQGVSPAAGGAAHLGHLVREGAQLREVLRAVHHVVVG